MNEVKPTNSTLLELGGSASLHARNGKVTSQAEVTSGKELPPSQAAAKDDSPADLGAQQESVEAAVSKLNDYIQSTQRDLLFSFDEGAGRAVVTVLNRSTDEVIRQIPEDVVLDLARKLNDEEPIRLFNAQA